MSRLYGLGSVFGSRTKKAHAARKRKDRRPRPFAAPEGLERRAMLAFAPLPTAGDQLGNDISITADNLNALHELSIILDDQTKAGFVTATITTKVDGAADQVAQYFNFGEIYFAGVNDTDGSVVNRVSLWTSYDADLVGNEIAPSADADVGLSTDWEVNNQFPVGISLGTTVLVNTLNADALTVTSGILGGGDSTIVGEFESPTLPENIDPTNPDTYANISLFSGVGIATNASGDAVVATALTLKSQTQGIDLEHDVFTKYDLSMEAAQDITLGGLVEVKEGDVSLFSSSGSIAVLELVHAMAGSITIDSDCDQVTIDRLCALEDITINAPQGVVVFEELRSENGGVTITADAGSIQMLGDIFTQTDFRMTAAEDATLWGVVEVTAGDVVIESTSGEVFIAAPIIHAVGGSIELVAQTGMRRFSGLIGVRVVNPGSLVSAVAPVVSVVIDPPASPAGRRAAGFATVTQIGVDEDGVPIWGVTAITLTDRGEGYADGEEPTVTVNGIAGVEAEAVIRFTQELVAEVDFTVRSRGTVNLVDLVRADTGNIDVAAVSAITVSNALLSAPAGQITINGEYSAELGELRAGLDVFAETARGIIATQAIISATGDVELTSLTESVTVSGAVEGEGVSLRAATVLATLGQVVARSGDVVGVVTEGSISVSSDVYARQGDIDLQARGVFQGGRGVAAIEIIDLVEPFYVQGQGAGYTPGGTRVIVSPPRSGGIAATAVPVIGPYQAKDGNGDIIFTTVTLFDKNGGITQTIKNPIAPIQGGVNSVLLTSPGSGYELGEEVTVQFIDANATKLARGRVTLQSTAPLSRLIADSGEIRVKALTSDLRLQSAAAAGDVLLDGSGDVEVTGAIKAGGSIISLARTGSTDAKNLFATDSISITALASVGLEREVYAELGAIEVMSLSGGIQMSANVQAASGEVRLTAHQEFGQNLIGVEEVIVVNPGTGYTQATVSISPPRNGGVPATGRAVIGRETGTILGVELITRGSGYSPGEILEVTISGDGDGASAYALASSVVPMIVAETDLTIDAGLDVSLVNSVRANAGDLTVRAIDGDLHLDHSSLVLHSPGGQVTLETKAGGGEIGQVVAAQGITIKTLGDLAINNTLVAVNGLISATSSAGDVSLNAIVSAELGAVSIDAFNNLESQGGIVTRIVVVSSGIGYLAETTRITINRPGVVPLPNGQQTPGIDDTVAATARAVVDEQGRIVAIDIVTPGRGYLPNEQVELEIEGDGTDATAVAFADVSLQTVSAKSDISLRAGLDLALVGGVRSIDGAVAVESVSGQVAVSGESGELLLQSLTGPVAVRALAGPARIGQISAGGPATVVANTGVSLLGEVDSAAGDVTISTMHGDLILDAGKAASIIANGGRVTLSAEAGEIRTPGVILAAGEVEITSGGDLNLLNTIASKTQDITAKSRVGDVFLDATVSAEAGAITVDAFGGIRSAVGALTRIDVLAGGSGYTQGTTTIRVFAPGQGRDPVTLQITPAREGTRAAIARPVIDDFGRVSAIEIVDPGQGYEEGDSPEVEIIDNRDPGVATGAAAVAVVDPVSLVLTALNGVTVRSGLGATVSGVLRSLAGDVVVETSTGDVVMTDRASSLNADAGQIKIVAAGGGVAVGKLVSVAGISIDAISGILLSRSIEDPTDPIDRPIVVSAGNIRLYTVQGDLSLASERAAITSTGGGISLTSESGSVGTAEATDAENDIVIRSHGNLQLQGRVSSRSGNVDAESIAAAVSVNATVVAPQGDIRIKSLADMETSGGGLTLVQIVNGGQDYSQATTLTVAPPVGGGRAASLRAIVENQAVVRIEIIDPGFGYAFGESPLITVVDPIERPGDPRGVGAVVIARSEQPGQTIAAGKNIELESGNTLRLFGDARSTSGNITVRSVAGEISTAGTVASGGQPVTLLAEAGSVTVEAIAGGAEIGDIVADSDITIDVVKSLSLVGVVESTQGGITLSSSSGNITMADTVKVHALARSIAVTGRAGDVSVANLVAAGDVTVFGEGDVRLNGIVHAIAGDVSVGASGKIDNASRLQAGGRVDVIGGTAVTSLGGGIVTLELLSGGNNYDWAIVDVAAPASGGGRAALARAVITDRRITGLELLDPGFGYAPGERVEVTFRGNPRRQPGIGLPEIPPGEGAAAVAIAGDAVSLIHAGTAVDIQAVTQIELGTELIADDGDIRLTASAGPLRVTDVYASTGIEIDAAEGVRLGGNIHSATDSITVASFAGGLDLYGTVLAPNGGVSIETASQIIQRGGSIRPDGLFLISGGRGYTFAELAVDPPPGAGRTALAQAVITAYDPPVIDANGFRLGYISDVILLDGGWGYPSDSIVNVSIVDGDGEGGRIVFLTTTFSSSVEARDDVSLRSGDSITLISAVRSAKGDVAISNTLGDIAVQTIKAAGDIGVESENGDVTLVSVAADRGATIRARQGVTVTDSVNANVGDVVIEARNKDVRFLPLSDVSAAILETEQGIERVPSAVVASQQGSITLTSFNGAVESPYAINAAKDVNLSAFTTLTLDNVITSQAGNIVGTSDSGRIATTSTISAHDGSITLDAHTRLQQEVKSGVTKIELLSPGPMVEEPPQVIVTVAPPRNGGTPATAGAIIDRRPLRFGFDDDNDNNEIIPYEYFIRAIAILDPGSGYEVGEQPLVTIEMFVNGEEIFGALARAFGPTFVPMIVADDNVTLRAGEDVLLVNNVRANTGDIAIQSKDGDLVLVAPVVVPPPGAPVARIRQQLVHALQGDILLETLAGKIEYQRIIAGQDLTMRSHETLTINNPLTTAGGDVTLASTGNNVLLEQNVLAADMLSIKAKTGIAQTGGLVKATDLYVENITPTAITLANAANDVDRFAAKNVGDVTYNDADEFRVGLRTSGPMTVEVTGASVSLSATDTIRVVAGIKATKLALLADTVEFVTTAAADNHLPNAAFTGTFRDMIAISNANTIRTSEHEFVFDEPGYPISEITVRGALPAFTRPVRVDGTTATGGRLGVLGSAGVATGVRLGVGSSGTEFTGAAFYGFSSGSAFVIDSSANTVSNLYFGLRADGSAAPANRIGVNASGARAFSNVIGSALEFDELTANRFAGHTDAAIVIQRGASNNLVAGNIVGGQGMTANRNGIRIDGGSGNRIGTAAQVTPDLRPTESNRISGNTHYGIEIRNVRGATTVVENNVVSGNATATGSGTHGIGVLNSAFVQIGGVSELARNQIFSQLGGSGVHLSGSNNVRILGNSIGTDGWHLTANSHTNDFNASRPDLGNGVHGIHVFGRSRDVLIDANRIVDNGASGVAIAAGSSGVVLTNNEIGAWVHPVTGNVHNAGNTDDGVRITAANGNTVGAGNVIGFNGGTGIMVENSVAAGLATGNRIFGAEVFRNAGHGVHISGSSRQTVGGTTEGVGNIVKENGLDGIRIETDPRMRASAAPTGNVVAGNFVGTNDNQEIDRSWGNRAGIAVINGVQNVVSGNVVMNNRSHGVEMSGGNSNTLGGGREADTNFIGYNDDHGIFVHDQASTDLPVGVLRTTITNGGAGYSASRARVIFSAPAASGGMAARGVAIISAAGRVTEIRLTSSGTGYELGEPVTVTVFDPQATVQVTATVTLGMIAAVNQVTRDHVISGNEIEANRGGVGIYVQGEAVTGIQIGQDFNARSGPGRGNKISFHEGFGVLVNAAGRVGVQGNELGNNGTPIDFVNANPALGATPVLHDLRSIQWGRGQSLVTGTITGGGAFHEYWVDVYSTPYWDLREDANDTVWGHQMRQYLGRTLVTTDANGNATIRWTLSEAVALGDSISATLTSNRYEDGATVGVWHSDRPHAVDLSAAPTTGSPTVTPTSPSRGTTTPTRGPVAPRG